MKRSRQTTRHTTREAHPTMVQTMSWLQEAPCRSVFEYMERCVKHSHDFGARRRAPRVKPSIVNLLHLASLGNPLWYDACAEFKGMLKCWGRNDLALKQCNGKTVAKGHPSWRKTNMGSSAQQKLRIKLEERWHRVSLYLILLLRLVSFTTPPSRTGYMR